MKEYQKYGIYTTTADGNGDYKFNHIPTGKYTIAMISENTTSSSAFNNLDEYKSYVTTQVYLYVKDKNAKFLGEYCGYHKFNSETIEIYEGEDTFFSYDFGISYT
jgi:hypothetical protein